ncbi:MAG TPA: biliverdin-producing heme oxygenase [Rhodopila sp.]
MTDLNAIKLATRDLHTRAERSGIIADILAGRASRLGVALLLRNLLPVYQLLDASALGHPALARSDVIKADLLVLSPGVDLPLLTQGQAYADWVTRASDGDTSGLLGHIYVRYLGDLNGGRIMQRRLAACLGEVGGALAFGHYPVLDNEDNFRRDYREELDRAVRVAKFETVKREALAAFELNIVLSEAVKSHVESA